MRNTVILSCLVAVAAACGGTSTRTAPSSEPRGDSPGTSPLPPAPDPGCRGSGCAYDGNGFVVHEWGTNTFVVGSDGEPLRGLHHEEEDLPSFVYDRVKGAALPGGAIAADGKMETPVTYFYSPTPLDVNVGVSFPKGMLTQWYPAVRSFSPLMVKKPEGIVDPVFSPTCTSYFDRLVGGDLRWGKVEVLARDANVDALLPDAPLDRYTWSHARAVAANAVRIGGDAPDFPTQHERFLFYRGLGNFTPPASVSWSTASAGVRIDNPAQDGAAGAVFVLDVRETSAAFSVVREGVAPGTSATLAPPAENEQKPLAEYIDTLGNEVVRALDEAGLYHDEAMSMVNTWRRQWFKTPGLRVLYLAAPSWIDQSIPLSIDPPPQKTTRAMVIRVELLTPSVESVDRDAAAAFAVAGRGEALARAHFDALGRFAEPRLRRALALLDQAPSAAAQAYLSAIAKVNASAGAGE